MTGGWALALGAVYVALALVGRVVLHRRRYGTLGIRPPRADSWVERVAGAGFVLGFALIFNGAIADVEESISPVAALEGDAGRALGFVLFALGLTGTVISQSAMGSAWRIGIERGERTELVTGGPFALVRNPIYTAMLTLAAGLTLLAPNALALSGLAVLWLTLQAQTRLIEEPHLLRVHGEKYVRYSARVGRFVPGLGRISARGRGGGRPGESA